LAHCRPIVTFHGLDYDWHAIPFTRGPGDMSMVPNTGYAPKYRQAFGGRSDIVELLSIWTTRALNVTGNETPGFKPVPLDGRMVRLEPLQRDHAPLLWDAAKDSLEDTFRWWPFSMRTREDFQILVDRILAEQERGLSIGFTTIERRSGCVVGSTRFLNLDPPNRRVEIGTTWVAPAWQRTGVNAEAKYLMLRHAFEHWNCLRVELKTDRLNQQSRTAILRLGATEEGTLRKHVVTWTGRVRDSVYFSILDTEWPDIKRQLEERNRH
jgi:RimJ/RimL family protein N-acetyltransferase